MQADSPTEPTDAAPPAHRPASILRRNLALCTGEGLVAMPIVYLVLPGNFIVAMLLTQTFPLGRALFGVIVSLPWWCNVIQLVVTPFLARRWRQKTIALAFSWLALFVWIGLGIVLPLIPHDDVAQAGRLFFFIFALSAVFQSIVGVSWTSWVQEWVPARLRGKYFGRRNRLLQLSTVAFLLVSGEVLTRLQDGSPVLGFQIVIGLSVFLRVFSILAQQRILATSTTHAHADQADLKIQLQTIRQSGPLLWLFGFGVAFGFATNLFGPFFNVFMYESLGRTVSDVSMLTVISNVTGAIALPAWGQFLDRYGNRPVMSVALFLWMLPGVAWAFLTPDSAWVLRLLYASGGVFQAGFVLGQFNILLKLVPPTAKTAAISLNVAATSIGAAIGPILGGILLDAAMNNGYERIAVYHGMSVVHHAIIILSIAVLLKVSEPKSAPLSQVVGAMRSSRQIFALLGMSFLVNYVFTKNRRGGTE